MLAGNYAEWRGSSIRPTIIDTGTWSKAHTLVNPRRTTNEDALGSCCPAPAEISLATMVWAPAGMVRCHPPRPGALGSSAWRSAT